MAVCRCVKLLEKVQGVSAEGGPVTARGSKGGATTGLFPGAEVSPLSYTLCAAA